MSVTDLRDLFEELARSPAPPTRSTAETTYADGRRRWRRRRAVTAATSTMMVAVTVAVATAFAWRTIADPVAPAASAGIGPPQPGLVQWAAAADADHLYLTYFACPIGPSCPKTRVRIVGSDDGGRTWTERNPAVDVGELAVLGPGVLLGVWPAPSEEPTLSTDGGRTWRPLAVADRPAIVVPPGGGLLCLSGPDESACRLHVVDPGAGTLAPLRSTPDLALADWGPVAVVDGVAWIGGFSRPDGWPGVAYTADGGRSWSVHAPGGIDALVGDRFRPPELITALGRTAFLVGTDHANRRRAVYRGTVDGGWRRLDGAEKIPYVDRGGVAGFVLPDGTHVIQQSVAARPRVDRVRFWAGDGDTYRAIELDGLPDTVQAIRRTPDGFYYTLTYGDEHGRLYGSADGRHWSRINQP